MLIYETLTDDSSMLRRFGSLADIIELGGDGDRQT